MCGVRVQTVRSYTYYTLGHMHRADSQVLHLLRIGHMCGVRVQTVRSHTYFTLGHMHGADS